MAINPNWPIVEDAFGPIWGATKGDSPRDAYVDLSSRTRGSNGISRGRQYELDQVRSGEYTTALSNTDGALDPVNASGPWAGHVRPFQPYRKRAMWPPSKNLLTQGIASGGDSGGIPLGTITTSAAIDLYSDIAMGSVITDATAFQGTTVLQFPVASGSPSGNSIAFCPQNAALPGQTYTLQMQIRNVTSSTSLQVKPVLLWYTASGGTVPTSRTAGTTVTLTGSPTATWTQITVTGTAPATAAGIGVGVQLAANAAATCNIQMDAWQLETGSSATSWVLPGVWYPLYAGFTERWPQQWTMGGTYGTVQPTCADAFSLLSQQVLSDPLTEEINARSPRFLYTLGDPQGVTSFADSTGNYPAAQVTFSKNGAGSLTSGNQITAANTTTGTYIGSTGTVVTLANPDPSVPPFNACSFISLGSAGILGPATQPWTRMIAFRYTGTTTNDAYLISAYDTQASGGLPSGSQLLARIEMLTQRIRVLITGPGAMGGDMYGPTITVADKNWHLLIFGHDPANSHAFVSIDGTISSYTIGSSGTPTGLVSDNIGSLIYPVTGNQAQSNFVGDVSYVAEFPSYFSSADVTAVYTAWKNAFTGDSTGARYQRILGYAGYGGPQSVQTGLTTSMGPASIGGQDAVSALQAVVDTESGEHFVARDGTVTFRARSARYNALTPVYTFGENTAAGEFPYEDCALDYDSTHLGNLVTVTQASTDQKFYAQDATSISSYFLRTLTRTVNSSNTNECQDAADYLLSRYKQPTSRIQAIKLHPSANTALWPVCLSLELGTRVRVMRRPPSLAATQIECFVENIQWSFDDTGEAWCTLQCSPADVTTYGIFAAFHTTLHTTIGAGVSSITIDAGQDNTNPAGSQLFAGQQLVLGQNTANQETVTIQSVGATSPGWTTAVITLTANTTKSHSNGDVVCEPLPAGTTDPTTWDQVSKFDSHAFAY